VPYSHANKIRTVSLDMNKELTIIGIVIVVIGIIVFATATYVYSVQSYNVQQCQLFTGELEQFLDPEVSEVCRTASASITVSLIAVIVGIVMIVIGGVLSAIGAIRRSSMQVAPKTTQQGQVIDSQIHPGEKGGHVVRDENENQSQSAKSDNLSVADELSKLSALKEKGVLTEEEFARLKKNLLNGRNSNA
jgi:uncharacterized membrane protein